MSNSEPAARQTQPDESLRSVCLQEGVAISPHAARSVVLAGADTCWYVADGSVDLFAVRQGEDGSLSGTQAHIRSVERGELLFGFNPIAETATVFVVRGNEAAELVTLPLAALTARTEVLEPLARAIDRWIIGSTRALCPASPREPNVENLLAPDQETAIAPNARFGPASDVVWVKGCDAFVYCATVDASANDGYFPLAPNGWMEPKAEGHVIPVSTVFLIADKALGSALGPALGRFNNTVLRGLTDTMEAAQARALARQEQRERRDAELLENAFGDALVVNRQADYVAHDLVSTDALTKAVARLALFFKTSPPSPDRHLKDLDPDQQLARLLTSAGLVSREIQLVGTWWQADGMPMVAWTKSGRPIVLWSVARRKYRYFDPADGRTGRVDKAFAATLSEKAHAIYPTLLKDRVSPWDLLRTGFRGGARDIVYMILFGAIAALIALITPSLTATLINVAIPESAGRTVIELTGVLISVAVVTAIFHFLQATSLLRVETIFESQAQAALWQRLMRLPSKFFRGFNSGNLALRAMGLSQIRTVVSSGLASAMLGGIFSFLNFIVMIAYGGWLALAAAAMMIVTLAFGLTANIMRVRRLRLAIMAHDDLAGLSVQSIAAIKKVRVAGAEDRLASKLISLHNRQRTYDYAARSIENWLRAYNTVIPLLSTAVFYAVVEFLFTDPPATGNFVAFTAAYGTFIVGITGMLNAVTMGLTAFVLYERLRPILQTSPEKSVGALPPGELSGRIEVNRVTFRYLSAGRPVLNDVSLTIEPGQFVAIVGPSGSGKSTLLRILLGFERPQAGSILYDGKDLSRLDVDAVRHQFGAILQNMQVLGGSIFENIAGSRPLTMDDAWRAAELACFDQDIKALPMQMHTVVNDGGTLSGGEKQRLMLARALAGKPKILFMDEATSALDNATQAEVAKSLSELDLTRVVVAHRLSTIKDADVIHVMQNGKIIDSGTAETLLEKSSLFAAFVERQQIEY